MMNDVNMKKYIKIAIFSIICCLALIALMSLVSCSSGNTDVTEITSAEIKKDKETVSVKATVSDEYLSSHKGERIYLLAMDSAYVGELGGAEVVANGKLKSKMTFKFELEGENGSLLASSFVLAELVSGEGEGAVYSAISKVFHIENPDIFSKNASKPDADHFKGLATGDVYEAECLGASSILFEAAMDELLLPRYEDGAINYFFDGRSYYFDGSAVERLDKQIAEADALGMRIYLRTVLKYPERDKYGDYAKEPITALYCAGATYGKNGYLPSAFGDGAGYIKAFYDFLGSRYGEKDSVGRVFDYLIGENVNDYSMYCNAGNMSAEKYLANYYSWARIADSILKSYSSKAQIYVSVDNKLRVESGAFGNVAFLEGLMGISNSGSDWDFGISLDLGSGDDLSTLLSGESGSYSYVGAKNLSDFWDALGQDSLLKGSVRRRVIIDSLSLSNELSEKNRATYYTYAYYKAAELGFDAFIYSADSQDTSLLSGVGGRDELYYAYLLCGSDENDQLKSYTDRIPNHGLASFSDHASCKLSYEQSVRIEVSTSIGKSKKDFPVGLESFTAAGGTYNADICYVKEKDGSSVQTLTLSGNLLPEGAAITSFDVSAKDIIESGYIGITLSSPTDVTVALIIDSDSSNALYVGEAEVTSIPETYFFNITPFTDDIKSSDILTVSLCVLPVKNAERVTLSVSEMALYGSSGNGSSTLLTIFIVIVSVLGVCGLLFLLTRRRKRYRRHDYVPESED